MKIYKIKKLYCKATSILRSPRTLFLGCLATTIAVQVQGFCNEDVKALEGVTKTAMDLVFSPWIKTTILGFAGLLGVFQAVGSGSWKPLLTWGGLGVTFAYVPKIIGILAKMGT